MITVATPWILGLAGAGALATCVLHLLSVKRPPTLLLPTMRFLPDRPVRAVSRSARPSDLLLLVLRVLALLLAGVAMAGVTVSGERVTHGRVVVIDRGGANVDIASLRARARETLRVRPAVGTTGTVGGGAGHNVIATRIVIADSTARLLSVAAMRAFNPDTLTAAPRGGSLPAAVLAAVHAASVMVRDESTIDSVEFDLVSPLSRGADDAALQSARALWPGQIRVVPVATIPPDTGARLPRSVLAGDAPNAAVLAALASLGVTRADAAGAKAAAAPSASASASASASRGAPNARASQSVRIEWPANGVPTGWDRVALDTIGALVAAGRALVAPFVRVARAGDALVRAARPIAWWSDGAVAAVEAPSEGGCTRQVAAIVPSSSNALQGAGARALLQALAARCGVARSVEPVSDAMRAALVGSGGVAPAAAFRDGPPPHTPYGSVLLLVALLLLAVEGWARDRNSAAPELATRRAPAARKVA